MRHTVEGFKPFSPRIEDTLAVFNAPAHKYPIDLALSRLLQLSFQLVGGLELSDSERGVFFTRRFALPGAVVPDNFKPGSAHARVFSGHSSALPESPYRSTKSMRMTQNLGGLVIGATGEKGSEDTEIEKIQLDYSANTTIADISRIDLWITQMQKENPDILVEASAIEATPNLDIPTY